MAYNVDVFKKLRTAGIDRDGAVLLATWYAQYALAAPAAAQADVGALPSAASVGVPTKVEFDKVVADLATLRTAHNALLAKMRTAGFLAT